MTQGASDSAIPRSDGSAGADSPGGRRGATRSPESRSPETGTEREEPTTFEAELGRLEAAVDDLESGDLGLEEAIRRYEAAVACVRRCSELLDAAERRVEILSGAGGSLEGDIPEGAGSSWRPFDAGEEPVRGPVGGPTGVGESIGASDGAGLPCAPFAPDPGAGRSEDPAISADKDPADV